MEKISIQSIWTSPDGKLKIITTPEEKKYRVYNQELHKYFDGVGQEVEIVPGKEYEDSKGNPYTSIANVIVDSKPVMEAPKPTGRSYGKSDKELLQQKQLEEAKQRSIQAQTALIQAVNLAIALHQSEMTPANPMEVGIEASARGFYQLLQTLTQISEAEVIHREVTTKAKPVKTEPTKAVGQPTLEPTGADDKGGGEVTNVQELMAYARSKGKYPSWVRQQAGIGDAIITDEMAVEIFKEIKWED